MSNPLIVTQPMGVPSNRDGWMPSPTNSIDVNFHGTIFPDIKAAGYIRFLLKDHAGNSLKWSIQNFLCISDPVVARFLAIKEGIDILFLTLLMIIRLITTQALERCVNCCLQKLNLMFYMRCGIHYNDVGHSFSRHA